MKNKYIMVVVAYQLTPNKKYKLAVRTASSGYRIIVVDDIHGLEKALNKVHQVIGSDIDGLTAYMMEVYNWSEPV